MPYTPPMATISDWAGTAFNQATASENRIHSDEVARRYGFRGGLVPGVTVYAYLVQPAITAWGAAWLERGSAHAAFRKPLYDGEDFRVETKPDGDGAFRAVLFDRDDGALSDSEASLPEAAPAPPTPRGDPPAPDGDRRPEATRAVLEGLRETGLGSLRTRWTANGPIDRYLRELTPVPREIRPDHGALAHPAFLLGLANTVLSQNVRLGPWIHVQSDVQHFGSVPRDSTVLTEATVVDLFERGGHEFVDLDVSVFLESGTPVLRAAHRAIYVLRAP